MQSEFLRQFMARHEDFQLVDSLQLNCSKHGPYTNAKMVQVHQDGSVEDLPLVGCPVCNREAGLEADRQETNIIEHEQKFASADIPAKYATCMLRNFVVTDNNPEFARLKAEARQKCMDFIEDKIRSIVLLGMTGLGKSHLGASMLKGCIQTGRDGLYVNERKIYRDIHESYLGRKDILTEGQVIAKYSRVPVLFIDEIGRSSWTDHETQTLHEIIDYRDSDNLKTIMAGNLLPPDFMAKFDDSFRRKLDAYELHCRWGKWEGKQ